MSLTSTQYAQRQYFARPIDERFPTLDALVASALEDKNLSAERTYSLRDLHVQPTDAGDLHLVSPKGEGTFTHWSFGQLARTLGAPASYLRELPAPLAADCLNYGLAESVPGTSANLLVRQANGKPEPIIRACTSESYGRLWDATLLGNVQRQLTDRDPQWTLPPTWTGEPGGAYRGDRDSFVILTNGGSIVNDPTRSGGHDGVMFRGILIKNSEVGASAVTIETILFRAICGNHLLMGAAIDKSYRRRHFGANVERDTIREIGRIAWNWAHQTTGRDQAIIQALIDHEIAHTKEAVVGELRAMGATKEQAEDAYATCERDEPNANPKSYWGIAQGLTRNSQVSGYQNDRYELDKLAALIMQRGARVAA
jgi:hypothetical protein